VWVHVNGDTAEQRSQFLVQALVYGRIERMPWTREDGIKVLVLVEMLLVEGDFPVFALGLAEAFHGLQAVRAKVGQNVLDPPQSVGTRLNAQPDLASCIQEVLFHIAWH